MEPKLFGTWDLEPEPKINLNKHFLKSILTFEDARMKKSLFLPLLVYRYCSTSVRDEKISCLPHSLLTAIP